MGSDDVLLSLRKPDGSQGQNALPTDDTSGALRGALLQGDQDQDSQAQDLRGLLESSPSEDDSSSNREPQGAFSQAWHQLPGDVMRAFSPSGLGDSLSMIGQSMRDGLTGNLPQAQHFQNVPAPEQQVPEQTDNRFALIRQYLGGG